MYRASRGVYMRNEQANAKCNYGDDINLFADLGSFKDTRERTARASLPGSRSLLKLWLSHGSLLFEWRSSHISRLAYYGHGGAIASN
eukprot:scaffold444736_cov35-Prasinocladus_malaysianus.AAC.1